MPRGRRSNSTQSSSASRLAISRKYTGRKNRLTSRRRNHPSTRPPISMSNEIVTRARVVHEEHGAITVPAGLYRVVRQREYVPGAYRYVAD